MASVGFPFGRRPTIEAPSSGGEPPASSASAPCHSQQLEDGGTPADAPVALARRGLRINYPRTLSRRPKIPQQFQGLATLCDGGLAIWCVGRSLYGLGDSVIKKIQKQNPFDNAVNTTINNSAGAHMAHLQASPVV